MAWGLVYNRSTTQVYVDGGRAVPPREFTYANMTDAGVVKHLQYGRLVEVQITFDPATATSPPVDYEALISAREVVTRNGGQWLPPTPPPWNPDFNGVVAALRDGRLSERGLDAKYTEAHPTVNRLGPISTDFTAVTINGTVDTTTYNQTYALTTEAQVNAAPVDTANGWIGSSAGYSTAYGGGGGLTVRAIRFMCDGDKFAFYTGFGLGSGAMIYVDGRPTSLTAYALANTNQWNTITFPSAKPRLIEIFTQAPMLGLYTQKPYTLWKPAPLTGPRMLVIGDSFVQGVGSTNTINGIYQNIGPHIGIEQVWVDGIGGTGYGVHSTANGSDIPAGGPNRYLDRLGPKTQGNSLLTYDLPNLVKPDIIVCHGGGINDLYKGRTVQQVISDATIFFKMARVRRPGAKLVFVEGFAPPAFTPATYNPNYIQIRTALQTALAGTGVYYIDVASTAPWITGTGRVGATTGVGNSDIYIGSDGAHPVDAGYAFLRSRMAQKLRQVIKDDGSRLNQLI